LYGLAIVIFLSFFPGWFHAQEYLLFSLLALALWSCWTGGIVPHVRSPLDLPLGLFSLWVLATVPFAIDPLYSLTEWRKFTTHALAFFWAYLVIRRQPTELWKPLCFAAVAAGTFGMSLYAVVEFFVRGGSLYSRAIRAGAPSSDYNWLSTYVVLSLPVLVAGWWVFRESRERLLLSLSMGLAALAQLTSLTRAGWLAHVLQAVAAVMLCGRRRVVAALLAFALVTGGAVTMVFRTAERSPTMDPWTFESRMAVWKLGLEELSAHPLVGIGYGNNTFLKRYPEYDPRVQMQRNERERVLPAMHSTFIMVALGSGIPALALFVWLFSAILIHLLHVPAAGIGRDERILLVGLGMAVLGFAVRNTFDYMFAGSLSYLFWILVAYGFALTMSRLPTRIGAS
jgi:heptosyltransferase-3/putative inorganic carbon (HCO3(-)) transporter